MKLLKWIKTLLLLMWLVSLAILGAWLVSDNSLLVRPLVVGLTLPPLSLGVYLCVFVLLGGVLGFGSAYLVTQGRVFVRQRALTRLTKEVKHLRSQRAKD